MPFLHARISTTLVSHQTFAPKPKFIVKKGPYIVLNINYCPDSPAILSSDSVKHSGSECLFFVVVNVETPDKFVS